MYVAMRRGCHASSRSPSHCIKYICSKLVVYEICSSTCTVVHRSSGSGAGVREITGDYRNIYTRRPRVTPKVSAVLVSAGLQCMQGSSRSGWGSWFSDTQLKNIDPCYHGSSCSLVALLGAMYGPGSLLQLDGRPSLKRNDNIPSFQAKEHTQGPDGLERSTGLFGQKKVTLTILRPAGQLYCALEAELWFRFLGT